VCVYIVYIRDISSVNNVISTKDSTGISKISVLKSV